MVQAKGARATDVLLKDIQRKLVDFFCSGQHWIPGPALMSIQELIN